MRLGQGLARFSQVKLTRIKPQIYSLLIKFKFVIMYLYQFFFFLF